MASIIHHVWYWSVTLVCVPLHFFLGLLCVFTPNFKKNNRALARVFIKIIAKSMQLKVTAHGLEHVPKHGPCIFMANHSSLIDILVMTIAIPVHFNFMAKKELFWVPFIGFQMILGGDILIDRNNPKHAKLALKKVEKKLINGGKMLIFPEGTRSTNGKLLPFKGGGFKLAATTATPIVPCYIQGSDTIVQKKSLNATPGQVNIYFSAPIPSPKTSTRNTISELMASTQNSIQSLIESHTKNTRNNV
jgi:1-acyl-sn-glycerol-3-phosphate acyltransferase